MTYEEAREFIEDSNKYGSKLGLVVISELLRRLGNPQEMLKVIHVAGTNGKGSTTAFIASILAAEGYSVGRYISPAVFTYREKVQISRGKADKVTTAFITEKGICDAVDAIKPVCTEMVKDGFDHPTSFEIETAMAFLYLAKERVDYAVIEVGLGGRLDATNVINHPLCCVITSISMDHMQYLGDSLEKIAEEKAGIIKTGVPVITGNTAPEVLKVLEKISKSKETNLIQASPEDVLNIRYSPEETAFTFMGQEFKIRLLGEYQINNAILAVQTAKVLHRVGCEISDLAIKNGLYQTKWSGRLEVLAKNPLFIIDGAHNEDAALQLEKAIRLYFPGRRLVYIMGVFADKDYRKVLQLTAPLAKVIITITPPNNRALASAQLAAEAQNYCTGTIIDAGTVSRAIRYAYDNADKDDVIIAFGSLSFLGEIPELLKYSI